MASKELTELSKTLANTPTNTPSNPTSSTSLTQFSEDPNAGFKSLLSNEIASSLNDQKNAPQTIASKYAERRRLAESAGADEQKLIESRFNDQIIDKQDEGFKSLLAGAEGQAGFSQQTAILRNISQDTDKRVKSLQKDREEAMLLGRIETAKRIDQLITDEQEAVTNAKKNYLSTLFQSSDEIRAQEQARRDDVRLGFEANAEERAQLSFETPEQRRAAELEQTKKGKVLDFATLAPDAGITGDETFGEAVEKYRNSESYKRDEEMGELAIQQARLDIVKTNEQIASERVNRAIALQKAAEEEAGDPPRVIDGGEFVARDDLTAQEQQKIQVYQTGIDLIDQIEKLYDEATGDEYEGLGQGAVAKGKGLVRISLGQFNPEWESYIRFLDSNRAPIAKGLKGEVGNLAEAEQKNALKSFPGRFTSPEAADKAFDEMRHQLRDGLDSLGEFASEPEFSSKTRSNKELDALMVEMVNSGSSNTSTPAVRY